LRHPQIHPPLDALVETARARLSPRRFLHSLGFCHTAMALASRWGANVASAAMVGVFHDLAKELSPEALRADLRARGHSVAPEDEPFQLVWHGQLAAVWAEQDHGVEDPATLEAIRLHATADAGVSLLTRIAFVADMTEPTRDWRGIEEVRRLARTDFDAAFLATMKRKIEHLLERNKRVHPRAMRALQAFAPAVTPLVEEETYGTR